MKILFASLLIASFWGSQQLPVRSNYSEEARVLVDDSTYCFQKQARRYRVRDVILQLPPDAFTKEQLVSLIHQYEPQGTPYNEVQILVISSEREADILTQAGVDTEASHARRREQAERLLGTMPIVAEYHRIKHDAALWFSTGKRVTGPIVLEGEEPYGMAKAPISFCVIQNMVLIGWADGRCLRRRISALVCPQDYTEDKLNSLWRFLDNRFPAPDDLDVYIRPNASELQKDIMGESTMRGIYPFVLRGDSFSTSCHGGSGLGWAELIRDSKGKRYAFINASGVGAGTWKKFPE